MIWARAVATLSGTGRAVMQTTMTTTDAIRDTTTILRWVVWSAVLSDALLMALSVYSDGRDNLLVNVVFNSFQAGRFDLQQIRPSHPTLF
jgi:hypothetical protein